METKWVLLVVAIFEIGVMADANGQGCKWYRAVEKMEWTKANRRWYEVKRSGEPRPENMKCPQAYAKFGVRSYALSCIIYSKNETDQSSTKWITETRGELPRSDVGRITATMKGKDGTSTADTMTEVLDTDYDNFALIRFCSAQLKKDVIIVYSRKPKLDSNSNKRIDEVLKQNGLPTSDTFHTYVQDCGRIPLAPNECPKLKDSQF